MFKQVETRFEYVKEILEKNRISTKKVQRAYSFAFELHKEQLRKDGTPYISHPVEVAIILADLGFDDDVICAGLLHDVVEDCGVTVDQIKSEFNSKVAELVDAVSAIESGEYKYNDNALFESEDFVKLSAEEQTFNKLIAFGKKNPLAFCIKFADRLHNLRTIASFERSKQLAKVRETEQWILPIAKILNASYFFNVLSNECFKILYNVDDCLFFKHYNEYHNANKEHAKNFVSQLKVAFSSFEINDILLEKLPENIVYGHIANLIKIHDIRFLSQGKIIKVPNYNLFVVFDKKYNKQIYNDFLVRISQKLVGSARVIDAKIDHVTNRSYFV